MNFFIYQTFKSTKLQCVLKMVCIHDTRSKRHQGQLGELKMLQAKRNSDNRDAQEAPEDEVLYGERNSGNQNPDYIHQKRDRPAAIYNLLAKRKEGHRCKFKALDTIRNSDNRNAPETPGEHPAQPADAAAKNKPQKISKTTHFT